MFFACHTSKANVFISVIMVAFISTYTITIITRCLRTTHGPSNIICLYIHTRTYTVNSLNLFPIAIQRFVCYRSCRSTLLLRKLTIFVFQLWFSLLSIRPLFFLCVLLHFGAFVNFFFFISSVFSPFRRSSFSVCGFFFI